MKYYSTSEIQRKFNLTYRRIQQLCKDGTLKGAYLNGSRWRVPEDALYVLENKEKNENEMLPLPIGVTTYDEAKGKYYIYDRTKLIKDIIDDKNKIMLFAYPKKSGKTMNMTMIKSYFSISNEDNGLFKNTDINDSNTKYTQYKGKYPCLYISFKNCIYQYWNSMFKEIGDKIIEGISEIKNLNNEVLTDYENEYYTRLLQNKYDEIDLVKSIKVFTKIFYRVFKKPTCVIIDDYDIPIMQAYKYGFEDECLTFFKNFYSYSFKDNDDILYGLISGECDLTNTYVFSLLSYVSINNIKTKRYNKYFTFNTKEVKAYLNSFTKQLKLSDIQKSSGGYYINNEECFNPYLVVTNIYNERSKNKVNSFYNNDYIQIRYEDFNIDDKKRWKKLFDGEMINCEIEDGKSYIDLKEDKSNCFSCFTLCGYLSIVSDSNQKGSSYKIKIANEGMEKCLKNIIEIKSDNKAIEDAFEIINDKMKSRVKVKEKKEKQEVVKEVVKKEKEESPINNRGDIQDYLL